MRRKRVAVGFVFTAVCIGLLPGCSGDGDSGPVVTVDLGDFVLDQAEKEALETTQQAGSGATGSYVHDEVANTLTLTFAESSFECDGPTEGLRVVATITELTATQLTWQMEGDEQTWTRVDTGNDGLVGVWRDGAGDEAFYLVIDATGTVTVIGDEQCGSGGSRNDRGCGQLSASSATIEIDGDLDDWAAVGGAATIEDPKGDHSDGGSDMDIRAMKVASSGSDLYVLVQLDSPPVAQTSGSSYRLDLQDTDGGRFSARFAYSGGSQAWEVIDPAGDSGVTAAAGQNGIEWRVSLDHFGSGASLEVIRIDIQDCSVQGGPCQILDEIADCGYLGGS